MRNICSTWNIKCILLFTRHSQSLNVPHGTLGQLHESFSQKLNCSTWNNQSTQRSTSLIPVRLLFHVEQMSLFFILRSVSGWSWRQKRIKIILITIFWFSETVSRGTFKSLETSMCVRVSRGTKKISCKTRISQEGCSTWNTWFEAFCWKKYGWLIVPRGNVNTQERYNPWYSIFHVEQKDKTLAYYEEPRLFHVEYGWIIIVR